jgi:hypothetical protein
MLHTINQLPPRVDTVQRILRRPHQHTSPSQENAKVTHSIRTPILAAHPLETTNIALTSHHDKAQAPLLMPTRAPLSSIQPFTHEPALSLESALVRVSPCALYRIAGDERAALFRGSGAPLRPRVRPVNPVDNLHADCCITAVPIWAFLII